MGLIEKRTLVAELAPPLDTFLVTQLVDEFVSMERRYIQRDWEPSELDGGQFCEVLARILYHFDSGNLSRSRDFGDCLQYIDNDSVPHAITPRHDALHLAKALRLIYKFRSQRGAVHISPTYRPNQMDARLLLETVRWLMNETLRIFWRGDREAVARAIRELLQFDVPCIGTFEEVLLVQRTDLSAEDEILLLLHYAGEQGFTRTEIGIHAMVSPPSVTRALQSLAAPSRREIIQLSDGRFRLTDLGQKKIRDDLANKLMTQ